MDPNTALANIFKGQLEYDPELVDESVRALQAWLQNGGFQPEWGSVRNKQEFQLLCHARRLNPCCGVWSPQTS